MRGRGVNLGVGVVVVVVVVAALLPAARTLPDVITIGGLFDEGDEEQKSAFRYAVDHVNRENILGRTKLNTDIEMIPPYDSFLASKRVCQLVWSGVAAIFGPQSGQTSAHVQSICDALEIPHIETRWDYRLRRDDYSVNLYPHPSSLSKAYLDLVRLFEWKSFCILYEDNDGLVRLQELLKTPSPHEFKVSIRQLPHGNDYRELLKEVRSSGEQNIILDCRTEKVGLVLKQAQQVDMMSSFHSYLITSMDLHLVDLEDFKYSGSNITGLRLIDPNRDEVQALVETWRQGRVMATNRLSDGDPVLKVISKHTHEEPQVSKETNTAHEGEGEEAALRPLRHCGPHASWRIKERAWGEGEEGEGERKSNAGAPSHSPSICEGKRKTKKDS